MYKQHQIHCYDTKIIKALVLWKSEKTTNTQYRDNTENIVFYIDPAGEPIRDVEDDDTMETGITVATKCTYDIGMYETLESWGHRRLLLNFSQKSVDNKAKYYRQRVSLTVQATGCDPKFF